jgi:hypothetical protein
MKLVLTGLSLLLTLYSFCQAPIENHTTSSRNIRFIAVIDIQQATKDGIYLNGYVVNLPYEKIKSLNGKTVRVKGKVTIVEGISHYTDGEIRQGRKEDSKHILKPKVKIVSD